MPKTCKPGETFCRGCDKCRKYSDMGEVYDTGRRPTIERCGACQWEMIRAMFKPDPVADMVAMLNQPPGETRAPIYEQETFDNDNDKR